MADLSGEPETADDRGTTADDAAPDAHLARYVDHVVEADGHASTGLGAGPEVGFVGHCYRGAKIAGVMKEFGDRDVGPAEIRGNDHNLNITRYVQTDAPPPPIDVKAEVAKLQGLIG